MMADEENAEVVARAIRQFSSKLQAYVLNDACEVAKGTNKFPHGSSAEIIELDRGGTKCVGKVLHSIFFEQGTESAGMQKMLEKFFEEIKLLSKMNHPNIVKFLGICYKQDSSLSLELPVLVMEKMQYSLTEYLKTYKKGAILEDKTLNILLDVSKGLVYLHEEMKVAHRDLSSNNILLAADLSAKIADLGSARVLDRPGGWNSQAKLTKVPGTIDFMPPEALEDPPKYTVSVDVFSFGCVIIHLCTHRWPTPIGKTAEGKIMNEYVRRKRYISEIGDFSYLLPIVRQCLEELGKNRPTSACLKLFLENIRQVTEFAKQQGKMPQQYILENVKEMPGKENDNETMEVGSYAKIIDLKFNDTYCVGKVLHSTLFGFNTDPSRIQGILEKWFSEIKLVSEIKHHNIVKFIGIWQQDFSLPVLVMEKMECSLTECLTKNEKGSIPEDKVLNILLDVSKGLAYLHDVMKVVHRDLSSNNILLAVDLSAKITNLGSAYALDRPRGCNLNSELTEQPGTLEFMPPEVIKQPPEYTTSVDVFSFGCVIIHLDTHEWPSPISVPEDDEDDSEIERRKMHISKIENLYLKSMVVKCLHKRNTERPSLAVLMDFLEAEVQNVKPDYRIIFTGITGAGKSEAGNFFLRKKAFVVEAGLTSVTDICSAATSTICDKRIEIIDTPGFFDGFTLTEENLKELIRAFILTRNGVHAIAFVISISSRYTTIHDQAIQELLYFKELQPFLFVLLTHAGNKGGDEKATQEYIKNELSKNRCPPGLKDLIDQVGNRVIMVESNNSTEDYYVQKSEQFIAIIETIQKINGYKMYTNDILKDTAYVYETVRIDHSAIKEIPDYSTKNENYFDRLTEKIMLKKMKASDFNENDNLKEFLRKWVKRGCVMGTIVGSVLPVLGNILVGRAGGYLGYAVGMKVHSFKSQHCNTQ